jgi:hypothetical protein
MKEFNSKLGTKFVFLKVHDQKCLFADAVLPRAGRFSLQFSQHLNFWLGTCKTVVY